MNQAPDFATFSKDLVESDIPVWRIADGNVLSGEYEHIPLLAALRRGKLSKKDKGKVS